MNNQDVVIISGATKGLGRCLSLAFAEAGYEVIGLYRSDTNAAKALEAEFREKNFQGVFIKQDITADGSWAEFDEIIKGYADKRFTVIANACAPFVPKPLHLIDWLEVSAQIDVNVKGAFLLFKRLLPAMVKARQGTAISVLTTALNSPPKGFGAYITAKSALESLTEAVAAEYAARGIKVFSVSPGFMETDLTKDWSDHLKALIYSDNNAAQPPAEIAAKILSLTKNSEIAGQGENYFLNGV